MGRGIDVHWPTGVVGTTRPHGRDVDEKEDLRERPASVLFERIPDDARTQLYGDLL